LGALRQGQQGGQDDSVADESHDPNEPGDPYAAIAAWYDIEHDALTEDVECLAELIGGVAQGRAAVLEIGAGTGRIAAGLALAGCAMTALEPSAAMRERFVQRLEALPERVARRVHVVAGSATAPGLDAAARFDAIVFGLDTFAHLTRVEDRLRALALAREHLRHGGRLLLDLDLAGLRRLAETAGQLWHQGTWPSPAASGSSGTPKVARNVSHFVTAAHVRVPGLVALTHFYDVYEQGASVTRTASTMTLALLTRGEVELALRHAGFRVEAVYGAYDQSPYEEGVGRALFVAAPD
jgi:SAM-dependent methyltransferase